MKRIGGEVYDTTRNTLRTFVERVVQCASIFAEYSKRKTITLNDIIYALKRTGGPVLYGFDERPRCGRRTTAGRQRPRPPALVASSEDLAPEEPIVIPVVEPLPPTTAADPRADWSAATDPNEPLPMKVVRRPTTRGDDNGCFHGSS